MRKQIMWLCAAVIPLLGPMSFTAAATPADLSAEILTSDYGAPTIDVVCIDTLSAELRAFIRDAGSAVREPAFVLAYVIAADGQKPEARAMDLYRSYMAPWRGRA